MYFITYRHCAHRTSNEDTMIPLTHPHSRWSPRGSVASPLSDGSWAQACPEWSGTSHTCSWWSVPASAWAARSWVAPSSRAAGGTPGCCRTEWCPGGKRTYSIALYLHEKYQINTYCKFYFIHCTVLFPPSPSSSSSLACLASIADYLLHPWLVLPV